MTKLPQQDCHDKTATAGLSDSLNDGKGRDWREKQRWVGQGGGGGGGGEQMGGQHKWPVVNITAVRSRSANTHNSLPLKGVGMGGGGRVGEREGERERPTKRGGERERERQNQTDRKTKTVID